MLAIFSSTWFLVLLGFVYVVVALWLIMVVLLQEGKSGGMAGMDSASQAPEMLTGAFGSGGTQRGLFRITSWTAAVFFVLAVGLTLLGNTRSQTGGILDLDSGSQTGTLPELQTQTPALDFLTDPPAQGDAPVVPVVPMDETP